MPIGCYGNSMLRNHRQNSAGATYRPLQNTISFFKTVPPPHAACRAIYRSPSKPSTPRLIPFLNFINLKLIRIPSRSLRLHDESIRIQTKKEKEKENTNENKKKLYPTSFLMCLHCRGSVFRFLPTEAMAANGNQLHPYRVAGNPRQVATLLRVSTIPPRKVSARNQPQIASS